MAGGGAKTRDAGNDILENVYKKIELLPEELNIKNYLEKQLQMDTIEPQGAEGCREDEPIKKRTEDSRGKKKRRRARYDKSSWNSNDRKEPTEKPKRKSTTP